MPAQMIDKAIPAPGLLAQVVVVVAKLDDHLPLYRQEERFEPGPACLFGRL
jgi:transposase